MIVKVQTHPDLENSWRFYDGVDEVQTGIISWEEHQDIFANFDQDIRCISFVEHPDDAQKQEIPANVVLVSFEHRGRPTQIFTEHTRCYLLNNEGKTIDRLN